MHSSNPEFKRMERKPPNCNVFTKMTAEERFSQLGFEIGFQEMSNDKGWIKTDVVLRWLNATEARRKIQLGQEIESLKDGWVSQIESMQKEIESKDKQIASLYESIEPDESDFERYPLPICFDPREEQHELYRRQLMIDGEWNVWHSKYGKNTKSS